MTEPTFTIRITPYLHITPRKKLYELRNRRNTTILNGNRYRFNEVIEQINKCKRQIDRQKNIDILNLLLS